MGNTPSATLQKRMERNKENFENLSPLCIRSKEIKIEKDKLSNKKRKLDDDMNILDKKRLRLESKLFYLKDMLENKSIIQTKIRERLQELLKEEHELHEKVQEYEKCFNLINVVFDDLFKSFETNENNKQELLDDDILFETVTFEEKDDVVHYNGRLSLLFDGTVDKYFIPILWDTIDLFSSMFMDRIHIIKTIPVNENNKVGKHEIFLTRNN